MSKLIKEAQKINCRAILITLATKLHFEKEKKQVDFPELASDPELYLFLIARYNQVIREVAEINGEYCVDLVEELKRLPEAKNLFVDDAHHFNEKGNITLAETIQKVLVQNNLVSR